MSRVSAQVRSLPRSAEEGDMLVERGREFGVNTGRRRRPGWFDAVMMRHAVRLNSLDELAITKLDILDCFERLKVCVAYESGGKRYDNLPWHQSVLHEAVAVYEEVPGWQTDTSGAEREEDSAPGCPRVLEVPVLRVGCAHHVRGRRSWS